MQLHHAFYNTMLASCEVYLLSPSPAVVGLDLLNLILSTDSLSVFCCWIIMGDWLYLSLKVMQYSLNLSMACFFVKLLSNCTRLTVSTITKTYSSGLSAI